jgi:hypothetical protein
LLASIATTENDGRNAMQELILRRQIAAGTFARSARHRLASECGQGTVEYVGLILLVSLLMVGMVAAMKGFNSTNS